MFVIVPLWLALIILLITRPIYGLKMIAGLLLGAAIGVTFWAVVIAVYGG